MRVSLLLLCALVAMSHGLAWTVEAGDERCVEQQFEASRTVHLFYEVITGGGDIDVTVVSPEGEQLYSARDESEGSYSFIAKTAGRHRFCFSNGKASAGSKTISFEVASGTDLKEIAAHPDHITPLEHGVLQLSEALRAAREDSSYMYFREAQHRDLTEATYERLRYVAGVEAVVLVAMCVAQIIYLRRFFERTRVV